jgi:SAM-dependent methyltransferase
MINEVERWQNLLTPGSALDIGAGDGETSLWLLDHGFQVDALEINPDRGLQLGARMEDPKLRWHSCSILDFPLPIAYYSLIIAGAVLHFIPPSKLEHLANAIIAALRPSGMLLASAFTEDDPSYQDSNAEGSMAVRHYFAANELRQLFSRLELLEYDESRRVAPHSSYGYRSGATIVARKASQEI